MSPTKILLTGATGYIGGSVLTQLLKSDDEAIKNSQLSVLVRGAEKAKAFSDVGINSILFNSLDESELLEKAASEHDIVIQTASGFHTGSAVALIKGLGKRKATHGGDPRYIHTSGTSNLADQPITGKYLETREFSDKDEDLYSYLKSREADYVYAQRTTDLAVIETGREVGIKTHIIMSPQIYGFGLGTIGNPNILSTGVSTIIRSAIQHGQAPVLGDGNGVWDFVHIVDVSSLYEIFTAKAIKNEPLRDGERGIYFSATGRFAWKELSQGVADAGVKLGVLKTNEVKSLSLEEAAQRWSNIPFDLELGFGSNSRTNSDLAKEELGWQPTKTDEDWRKYFFQEFSVIYKDN